MKGDGIATASHFPAAEIARLTRSQREQALERVRYPFSAPGTVPAVQRPFAEFMNKLVNSKEILKSLKLLGPRF